MKLQFTVLLAFLCLATACSNRGVNDDSNIINTTQSNVIKFHPEHRSDVYIEDIVDTSFFRMLSTDRDFLLSYIQKIYFSDSVIIIPQDYGMIYLYDLKGNPIRKIDAVGRSGGKLPVVHDVWYNENSQLIDVYGKSKIISYDLSGKIVKEENVEERNGEATQFRFARSENMVLFERIWAGVNNNNRLGIYGSDMKFKKSLLPLPERITKINIGRTHVLENYRDSLYYLPILEPRIYAVNSTGISTAYEFYIPKHNRITADYLNGAAVEFEDYLHEMRNADFAHSFARLYMSDKYVSFNYQKGGKPLKEGWTYSINVFFSKQSKKVLQFSHFKSKEDPGLELPIVIKGRLNDYYVTAFHPGQIIHLPEDIQKKLNDNGNPILMFFKLKDF